MRWRSKAAAASFQLVVSDLGDLGDAAAPPIAVSRVERILRHVARTAVKSDRGWHGLGDGGMTILLDHMMPWSPAVVRYFDAGMLKRVASPQWLMMGPKLDIVFGVSHDWTVRTGPIDPTFYLRPEQLQANDLAALYRMAYATLRQLANIADPLPIVVVEREKPEEPKPGDDNVKCA